MAHHRKKDPLIWGLVLIVIGAIFFLENFGLDVWDTIWKLWPVLLIVWGGLKLYKGLKEGQNKLEEKKNYPSSQDKP